MRADPEPEPVRADPPLRRNSIYSGSAIPLGPPMATPAPTPAPKPHPEIAPAGETPPPLRTTTFVAPEPGPRPRRSLRRHVPLLGSLATAAAGFALVFFVLTRPPPQLVVPPPHRPAHIAVTRTDAAPPQLRGALQRLGLTRRPAARAVAPPQVQTVSTAPVEAPSAAPPKAAAPRFTPSATPDPDAPIATRPPYS